MRTRSCKELEQMSRFRVAIWICCLSLAGALCGCASPETNGFATPHEGAAVTPIAPKASRTSHKTSPAATDWDSFGFDLQRTGYNPYETTISASNVASLQKLWSANVGNGMVHEPVLASNVSVSGQSTNVLYAGSASGSTMYAIDANNGTVLWKDPVPNAPYRCDHTNQTFSIGETPAIDRGKDLLYFSDGHNQVHAVDLVTGKEPSGWPIAIAQYQGDHNFMHGGLTYNPANGLLYAVTGSQVCDISPWHGRIVAINTSGPYVAGTFFTMSGTASQGGSGGGIWGPGGASIDPSTNNVFVATGNGDTHGGNAQNADYSEQVIELSPTLNSIVANNYPTNIPMLSGYNDFDFGATPLLFTPYGCPLMLAAVNKSGMFELYDVATIGSGPVQYIAMSFPSDKGVFVGVPAYDPVTNDVYVGMPSSEGPYKAGLAAFGMASNCTLNPQPVWAVKFGPDARQFNYMNTPRSPVSIANGVVYIANHNRKREMAFDAATGAELWTTTLSANGDIGTLIANGVVYVSSLDGTITAWTLPTNKEKRNSFRHAETPASTTESFLDRLADSQ
jgi:outer membrane protein assembly factor BamB